MYNFKAGRTAALQKFCQFNFMCGVQCAGDGDGDGGSGGRVSCVRLKQKNCVFHKWKTWIEFPDFTSSSSDIFFCFFYSTIVVCLTENLGTNIRHNSTHTPQIPTVTATIFAIQLSFFLAFNIHFLKHDAQPLPTVVKYICDANLLLYIETVCGFQLTSSTTIICEAYKQVCSMV